MSGHTVVGSNDIERSKRFYDAIFTAVGGKEGLIDPEGRLIYTKDSGIFMVVPTSDVPHAVNGNGSAVAFVATDPDQVNTWHEAGIAAGGTAINDPPGVRRGRVALYLAYLGDPDGNKLCSLYDMTASIIPSNGDDT